MRAVAISRPGGPEVLQVVERPDPVPGPSELLVRVAAAGLNRADLLQRRGQYPAPAGVPPDIPGLEYAGVVAALGPGVSSWQAGDRVMGLVAGGAYAEYLVTPADQALPIPAGWSFPLAAAVPEAFVTAYDALVLQGGLRAGYRVLIHAVGSSVGTAALQLAKAWGATVTGTSRSAWKLDRARTYGLDRAVLVEGDFQPGAELADWADLIVDLVGGPYLAGNLEALAHRGRCMVVGLTGGRTGQLDLGRLLSKRAMLIGTVLRSRPAAEKAAVIQRFREAVLPLFEAGRLEPVLDRVFPLSEVGAAHRYLEGNRNFGSVVLDCAG